MPLTHVVGNDEQDRSQRGKGNEASQRRGEDEYREQGERVRHSGDRGECAGTNIGGGASDGARGRYSTEEGRCDIGDALGDELDVGVVAIAAHAIGNYGGEQALNGRKQRHGKSGGKQGKDVLGVKRRECEVRKTLRNTAEAAANGFYRQMEESRSSRCEHQRNDGAGNASSDAWPEENNGESCSCDSDRLPRRVPA